MKNTTRCRIFNRIQCEWIHIWNIQSSLYWYFWELVRFLGGPASPQKNRWSKSCWLRYFFMIFIFLDYFLHLNFVLQNSIGKPMTKLRVNLQLNYEFSMNFARLMRTSLLAMPLIRPHSLLSGVALLHDRLRLKFHILYAVNHRPLVYLSEPIFKNVRDNAEEEETDCNWKLALHSSVYFSSFWSLYHLG